MQSSTNSPNTQHKPPFLIGGIADLLRWWELLIFTVSAPVLSVATVIAVVDLLTGGRLLATQPNLVFAFGVALAIGIDSQLPAACERVRDAWESKRWFTLLLWAVIALWTGLVIFTALRAFSIEQAQHVTEEQALAIIGFDPGLFSAQRDLLAVVLLGLSGFARIKPRAVSRAEERETLQRELEMEPLRQQVEQLKARRVVSAVATGRAAVAAAVASPVSPVATPDASPVRTEEETPTRPPTGGGSPVTARPSDASVRTDHKVVAMPQRSPARPSRKTAAQARATGTNGRRVRTPVATANYEIQARAAWVEGARSVTKMERATGMGHSAAQSWVRTLKAEAAVLASSAASAASADAGQLAQ